MKKLLMAVVLLLACAQVALACTGFLTSEGKVKTKSGRYVKLCYYDHLGDPYITTMEDYRLCPATINIKHHNEDRDGDGENDDEEGQ
jgi:hypothetical protein